MAYSNSKLAILYYAHELQRRAPAGINVAVFEPGFMPGTGLSRGHGPGLQRVAVSLSGSPAFRHPPDPGRCWRRLSSTTAGRTCETARSSSKTKSAK